MKKALSKMLAMMLTAALLLSGCGGGTTAEKPAENSGRVYAKRFYTYGNASFSEKIPEKTKRRRAL